MLKIGNILQKKKIYWFSLALWVIGTSLALIVLFKLNILLPGFDNKISLYFSSNQNIQMINIMKIISFLSDFIFIGLISVIIVFYLNRKRKNRDAAFYSINLFLGLILQYVLKEIFKKSRPINPFEVDYSFPSGHAVISILVYGSISYLLWIRGYKKTSILICTIPLFVSFSRLYLNAHWMSDIIAGILLGIVILDISIKIFYPRKKQR